MPARNEIEGLLLCKVGRHRLAFVASAVSSIGAWVPSDGPMLHARHAYGLVAVAGKTLNDEASSVVVDAVEVSDARWKLMPVPEMLRSAVGGALQGFVTTSEGMLPLLALAAFSKFVAALGAR